MDKSYDPTKFEDEIYKLWMQSGSFCARPNPNKKPFTVMMPPPNITGQLHIGHALNNSIQDAVVRYKRMKGFETLWLPGTDHASIATEVKIADKLKSEGTSKQALGREGFLKKAFEWNDVYGGRIFEQFKKLGLSCDWEKKAFTMDEPRSKAVRHVFVSLYNKGLIYRGDRLINWCPDCKTALSDAEVEHEQTDARLWHIKYKIENCDEYLVVATTRPETLLGDSAVAVNPLDKRYSHLVGKNVVLPLANRLIPIIADSYVDMQFGSGAVKITPAHDPNDFEVGLRHNLPQITVMNSDGTMASNAGKYMNMNRYDARKLMLEDLQNEGLLLKTQKHTSNVGHCYRCRNAIEPMISKQWFVKMEDLAKPAIDVVKKGELKIMPKRFEKVYLHWLSSIRDWCISRQLWWGHRIPVFYCDTCGKETASEHDIDACPVCGAAVRQDEDVLDTWFSSALWPFATLGYPQKTEELSYFYPTDVLITAYDIIFFWVVRMVFSGIEHMGELPFRYVYINGLVRDDKGKKMSKSSDNGIDPLDVISTSGADSLRMSLLSGCSAGADMRLSKEKVESCRNFMNKIHNAARFVLMNAENADILDITKIKTLSMADKWILTRLSETTAFVVKQMDKFEIGAAANKLYDFIWSDFCDWYIELSKTALFSENRQKRSQTVGVLLYVLRQTLKLIHPIIPFITEEIYQSLPNKDCSLLMNSPYPQKGKLYKKDAANMQKIMGLVKSIRNVRAEMNVSQSRRTMLYVVPRDAECEKLLRAAGGYIVKLAMGNDIQFCKTDSKSTKIVTELGDIYLPLGELIDFAAERDRLKKELDVVISEIARATGKLNNAGFVAKAPKELLEAERAKLAKYTELKIKLENSLKEIN